MTANRKLKQKARTLAAEQSIRYPAARQVLVAAGDDPYPSGTVLRVAAGDSPLPEWSSREGTEFVVADYVSASEAEDGIAFYEGWGDLGTADAPATHVVLVRTSEQQANREAPSIASLAKAVASAIHGLDVVRVDQTDHSRAGEGTISVEGRTHEGLLLSFTVRISEVEVVDNY